MALGATVKQFAPQGAIDQQTSVTAQFSSQMVRLGDVTTMAPFVVNCGSVGGEGRWVDSSNWVWQMQQPLQSGERCEFVLRPDIVTVNGERVTGKKRFEFFVPGPWPRSLLPVPETVVDENQAFIISVGGGILPTTASVESSIWCEADGVGNRIPVRLLPDTQQQDILTEVEGAGPEPLLVLSCVERLPPGAKMKLVWGKGIKTADGVQSEKEEAFVYTVRQPFRASLNCEREKAGAACSPLSSVRVEFTAPVEAKTLQQARLVTPAGPRSPNDPSQDGDDENRHNAMADSLLFPGPLPQNAEFQIS